MKPERRLSIILTILTLSIVGLVLFLQHRHVQLYKVVLLPSFGGKITFPLVINDRGQIVGQSEDAAGKIGLFLWERDKGMQPLDLGTELVVTGLHFNNAGQVAGTIWDPNVGVDQAFLWDSTTGNIQLGALEGSESFASDLNNRGQVVGSSESTAFIWDEAQGMRSLRIPKGFTSSMADIVNDAGQVLGLLI